MKNSDEPEMMFPWFAWVLNETLSMINEITIVRVNEVEDIKGVLNDLGVETGYEVISRMAEADRMMHNRHSRDWNRLQRTRQMELKQEKLLGAKWLSMKPIKTRGPRGFQVI
jgi:hypothetical protein